MQFFSCLGVLLVALLCPTIQAKDAGAYHGAQTMAEKQLSIILDADRMDKAMLACILNRPDCASGQKNYDKFFMPDLLQKWARQDKALVQQNCKGSYSEGKICGVDHDPVICARDKPNEGYIFRTVDGDDQSDIVIAHPAEQSAPAVNSVYQMHKTSDGWKLAGVDCVNEADSKP